MKKNTVLLCFFIGIFTTSIAQEWTKFVTDGTGKSEGLKLATKFPSHWRRIDGTRPHIVKLFQFEDSSGQINAGIYIKKLQNPPAETEIEYLYSLENIKNVYSAVEVIEYDNTATVDLEKCVSSLLKVEGKVYEDVIKSVAKVNYIIWDKYLIQINFMIFSFDQEYNTMIKLYEKYKDIFDEVLINTAILSKWEG